MRSAQTISAALHDLSHHVFGDLRAEVLRAHDSLKAALDAGDVVAVRAAMLAGERVLEIVQTATGDSVA